MGNSKRKDYLKYVSSEFDFEDTVSDLGISKATISENFEKSDNSQNFDNETDHKDIKYINLQKTKKFYPNFDNYKKHKNNFIDPDFFN